MLLAEQTPCCVLHGRYMNCVFMQFTAEKHSSNLHEPRVAIRFCAFCFACLRFLWSAGEALVFGFWSQSSGRFCYRGCYVLKTTKSAVNLLIITSHRRMIQHQQLIRCPTPGSPRLQHTYRCKQQPHCYGVAMPNDDNELHQLPRYTQCTSCCQTPKPFFVNKTLSRGTPA